MTGQRYPDVMDRQTKPPSSAYQKPNGMWTFQIEVNGQPREAGEYPDEQEATREVHRAHAIYEANKDGDGSTWTIRP